MSNLVLFFKKALLFLKHYWPIPAIGAIALIMFIVARKKQMIDWQRVLRETADAHETEVKKLQHAHEVEKEANARDLRRAKYIEEQLRAEFEKTERALDKKQIKRAREISDELRDDPHALSKKIEAELGVRVIVIE